MTEARPTIPPVEEWELDNAWRRLIDEYETKREISPSVLAQGLILFAEVHGIVKPSLDDFTDAEFVVLVFQVHMVRPDPDLAAAASVLLGALQGPEGEEGAEITYEAEADLEALVAALYRLGGPSALRH